MLNSTKKFIVACVWAVITAGTTIAWGVNWFSWFGCFMTAWIIRYELLGEVDPDDAANNENKDQNN